MTVPSSVRRAGKCIEGVRDEPDSPALAACDADGSAGALGVVSGWSWLVDFLAGAPAAVWTGCMRGGMSIVPHM